MRGKLKAISFSADSMRTTSRSPDEHSRDAKVTKVHKKGLRAKDKQEHTMIEVERSGDWMPAEELRDKSLSLLGEGRDITLNLDKVEYLDASALQILLALDMEQKKLGQHLHLENASPYLRQWFEFAGAGEQFALTERNGSK